MELNDLTIIGKLGFGDIIKGWIPIRLNPDFLDYFERISHLFVIFTDHRVRYVTVKNAKIIKGKHYIKLVEPEIMLEIEKQTNLQAAIDQEIITELTSDEYYDPIGMKVMNNNTLFGEIIDWFSNNAQDVFVVKDNSDNELLIPDVDVYVQDIDYENRIIYTTNIEQLLNL
ncbi:MAG TPA: ribosome maturation factor RimM [Candidatus Cloacimonadota bacterium]|jgi:16S rRNA processing protein RimM|nr:ribosome maturation factor RimM [Candidatus Cloacimonadales bacterium]HPY97020.1 ribosome maturation factor RimM [Candidatus Cloacimonadota bacterium]HQB41582.1 ribosome maturation factor RimM [Candidatus Cloacimonadota bacterium]